MLEHVYERVSMARYLSSVVIATDDERIFDEARRFGAQARMTRSDHLSGTDRVAEVASAHPQPSLIVNVQGDEPLIDPAAIDAAILPMINDEDETPMATLAKRIEDPREITDPNVVKVVTSRSGLALYFSRSRIPSRGTCSLHIGLYVYRVGFLREFTKLERTRLEIAERLEQLRALEHGYRIRVVEVENESWGIDTPEDLERFNEKCALNR